MFRVLEELRKQSKVIGFTCSTFDLLHAGHIMMLQESRAHCDFLVVGLLTDPTISRPTTKNKPVQSMLERYIQLQAVAGVDMIIPWEREEDLDTIMRMIRPDIRFVGEEYIGKTFGGFDACKELDIKIFYNSRKHHFGSSELRNRTKQQDYENSSSRMG